MNIIELGQNNFEEQVIKAPGRVLVDFWASWCGPCRALSPIVDEVADELEEPYRIGKVNVDSEQELARKYGVMSIPTLIVFENGKEIKRSVGVIDKIEIVDLLTAE